MHLLLNALELDSRHLPAHTKLEAQNSLCTIVIMKLQEQVDVVQHHSPDPCIEHEGVAYVRLIVVELQSILLAKPP